MKRKNVGKGLQEQTSSLGLGLLRIVFNSKLCAKGARKEANEWERVGDGEKEWKGRQKVQKGEKSHEEKKRSDWNIVKASRRTLV